MFNGCKFIFSNDQLYKVLTLFPTQIILVHILVCTYRVIWFNFAKYALIYDDSQVSI